MEIQVRRVNAADVIPLRRKVLRQGMPAETAIFPGDEEPETFHLGAMRNGEIVGIATFLVRPYPLDAERTRAWQLRGMAVDPDLQGQGVGSKILDCAIDLLRGEIAIAPRGERHVPSILWCNARIKAVEFYRQNGWITEGEEFDVANFGPHSYMRWQPESETRKRKER
jgi:GNAT superfamily N-acetyltransferase